MQPLEGGLTTQLYSVIMLCITYVTIVTVTMAAVTAQIALWHMQEHIQASNAVLYVWLLLHYLTVVFIKLRRN